MHKIKKTVCRVLFISPTSVLITERIATFAALLKQTKKEVLSNNDQQNFNPH